MENIVITVKPKIIDITSGEYIELSLMMKNKLNRQITINNIIVVAPDNIKINADNITVLFTLAPNDKWIRRIGIRYNSNNNDNGIERCFMRINIEMDNGANILKSVEMILRNND